jgi:ubiquitin carboxyl-terminal hydrolase L3
LDPEFLQFTPQPVFAVLLLFPSRGKLGEERKKEEEAGEGEWTETDDESKKIWWIKQTVSTNCSYGLGNDRSDLVVLFQIGNACGSIGLLHSLLNLPRDPSSPYALAQDSLLAKFYQDTKDLSGIEKAKALDAATFFEEAHKRVAESGQSAVPRTADELENVDLHFISFVEGTAADG